MFIDTHTHPRLLQSQLLKKKQQHMSLDDIVTTLYDPFVQKFVAIGVDTSDTPVHASLSEKHAACYFCIGIHPCDVEVVNVNDLEQLANDVSFYKQTNNKLVGIGETGLDFYHNLHDHHIKQQYDYFHAHINIAIQNNLPLVIHSRESLQEVYRYLRQYKGAIKGVIHCFEGSLELAKQFIDIGFFLGIGGRITYPLATDLKETVAKIGISYIVSETDTPFLPLFEKKGTINTAESIPSIIKEIAQIAKTPYESTCEIIKANCKTLFNW